jgi:hypothetical protein
MLGHMSSATVEFLSDRQTNVISECYYLMRDKQCKCHACIPPLNESCECPVSSIASCGPWLKMCFCSGWWLSCCTCLYCCLYCWRYCVCPGCSPWAVLFWRLRKYRNCFLTDSAHLTYWYLKRIEQILYYCEKLMARTYRQI